MKKLFLLCFAVLLSFCGNSQQVIKYTTANLNLRSGESTSYPVLTVIPKNTPITMYECDCNWIYVEYDGYRGYVSSKYISKNKPSSTPPLHTIK